MFKIGKVVSFYPKISIAIVEIDNTLALGDTVRFVKDGQEVFEQNVDLMQIGHEKITVAKRGDVVGLKTKNEVEKETEIFKV